MTKNIHVNTIIYQPHTVYNSISFFGFEFVGRTLSPNVFVLETEEDVNDECDISFIYNDVKYTLMNPKIYKPDVLNTIIIEPDDYVISRKI